MAADRRRGHDGRGRVRLSTCLGLGLVANQTLTLTLNLTLTRYVYIADRLKELIKYKGHQVAAHLLAYVLCTKSRT